MEVRLDPERLQFTRDALRTGGLLVVDPKSAQVRDPILRSWRRCVSAAIPSTELRTRRIERVDSAQLLTRAAAPVLDRLREELTDLGVAVLLSNRSGRILSRHVADSRQLDRLDDNYVLEGFDYSEHTVGTNGLGTAIEEKRAVWVHGAEHFNDALQVFACVGVPILSPRGGSVVGCLSLAATAAASNPMMMSVTKLAARQVEQELRAKVYARESALAEAFSQRSQSNSGPAMLLTDDSVLSDTRLLPMMTPSSHVALWEAVHRHDWAEQTASFEIELSGSLVEVFARRVEDADGPAYLLHFPKAVPDRLRAFGRTLALNAGRLDIADRSQSVQRVHPVDHVDARLKAASQTADLLALEGPAGCGKLHSASQLALATGRELLVLDMAMLATASFDDWLPRAARFVEEGNCVVVRRAEQLTEMYEPALTSLVSAQARAKGQRGLLITTADDSGISPPFRQLLDRLAVTVTLPGLTEMRDVIPQIATDLLASIRSEGKTLTISSSALQALIRWNWPGNVRELRSVLSSAALSASTGVIHTDNLPGRLVAAHRAGSLSGIERAERSAIVGALERCQGNRSRAAAELGIGRTTLYRKLRELKIADSGEWLE
jgi:hypothetical protein